MLVNSIALFLGVSILLYCLLAGADFGAGILEIFSASDKSEERQRVITRALGPVWEANHVWLILAVVILFNGFPLAFSALSITFHIPLTIMLFGIILRGSAFTFRHYDVKQGRSHNYYGAIFGISSVLTPVMLGIVAGASLLGRPPDSSSFWGAYVSPWCNVFCFAVGIFCCVLFAFLAAVYLIGESEDQKLRAIFVKDALVLNGIWIAAGSLVFIAAQADGLRLFRDFISNTISLICVLASASILAPLWYALRSRHALLARVCAATQVALILCGWIALQFPTILASGGIAYPGAITIYNSAAAASVLHYLLYALLAGSALIFPALFFLLKIFKSTPA